MQNIWYWLSMQLLCEGHRMQNLAHVYDMCIIAVPIHLPWLTTLFVNVHVYVYIESMNYWQYCTPYPEVHLQA